MTAEKSSRLAAESQPAESQLTEGQAAEGQTAGGQPAEGRRGGRRPARERLLDAANELFYADGVHTVGIDRVIERAGVAKATLYSAFGSKDELIRAYLMRRHLTWRQHMTDQLASRFTDPRERLLGVFDVLGESFARPGFHGCAFANASAESPPGGPVEQVSDLARGWLLTLFTDLGRAAGAADPEPLARHLAMLYHGASLSARMDRDVNAAAVARSAATTLLDATARVEPGGAARAAASHLGGR